MRRCISQEVNVNSNKKIVKFNIKQICKDELIQLVIKRFDNKKTQVTKRMVNSFIKYKIIVALYCIFKVKK